MPHRKLDQELVDRAVRKSLEYNSSSSVMFLLRERMIREIIEVAMPIFIKPLLERIAELEKEIKGYTMVDPSAIVQPTQHPVANDKLDKLRKALDEMSDVIE
jgi:hypothetical protein